jgi:hypothetical protein
VNTCDEAQLDDDDSARPRKVAAGDDRPIHRQPQQCGATDDGERDAEAEEDAIDGGRGSDDDDDDDDDGAGAVSDEGYDSLLAQRRSWRARTKLYDMVRSAPSVDRLSSVFAHGRQSSPGYVKTPDCDACSNLDETTHCHSVVCLSRHVRDPAATRLFLLGTSRKVTARSKLVRFSSRRTGVRASPVSPVRQGHCEPRAVRPPPDRLRGRLLQEVDENFHRRHLPGAPRAGAPPRAIFVTHTTHMERVTNCCVAVPPSGDVHKCC